MAENTTDCTTGHVASRFGALRRAVDESRFLGLLNNLRSESRAQNRLLAALQRSTLVELLTTDPDPPLIVVDLRETVTVGPVVRLLDAVLARIGPYWRSSICRRLLNTVAESLGFLARTRLARRIEHAFEPPETGPDTEDMSVSSDS